ncbi:hypothetical protein RA307_27835 [Xanthobacteraceae bacterium Astr-EGSB]|uniref:hypothetical protein n=1 Tax=Astrobacterium formosum TaxID=3069710 RepID=UPI0027B8768E|nr:hypothetical protein [Xanthobacteraceae bacterium Astr-EGSB]
MSASHPHTEDGWLGRATQWLRERGQAMAACRELDNCGEAERLAQDCGIPLDALRAIAKKGPNAARELADMLRALNLDPAVLDRFQPAVMRDLQHHCCLCDNKSVCHDELAAGHAAESYTEFCANADTLKALTKKT